MATNKLASPLTHPPSGVKCRATSEAKKWCKVKPIANLISHYNILSFGDRSDFQIYIDHNLVLCFKFKFSEWYPFFQFLAIIDVRYQLRWNRQSLSGILPLTAFIRACCATDILINRLIRPMTLTQQNPLHFFGEFLLQAFAQTVSRNLFDAFWKPYKL